jgi:hypothetical protein
MMIWSKYRMRHSSRENHNDSLAVVPVQPLKEWEDYPSVLRVKVYKGFVWKKKGGQDRP